MRDLVRETSLEPRQLVLPMFVREGLAVGHRGFGGQVTPEEGAQTPLWLALSEDAGKVTGCYAENQAFTEDAFTQNKNELEQLKFVLRSYITH